MITMENFYINLINKLFTQLEIEFSIRRGSSRDEIREPIIKGSKADCILQRIDEVMKTVKELPLAQIEESIKEKLDEVMKTVKELPLAQIEEKLDEVK